jgi:hypothetical protein
LNDVSNRRHYLSSITPHRRCLLAKEATFHSTKKHKKGTDDHGMAEPSLPYDVMVAASA